MASTGGFTAAGTGAGVVTVSPVGAAAGDEDEMLGAGVATFALTSAADPVAACALSLWPVA